MLLYDDNVLYRSGLDDDSSDADLDSDSNELVETEESTLFEHLDTSDIFEPLPDTADFNADSDIDQLEDEMPAFEVDDTKEPISDWIDEINPNYDEFDIDSPYSNNCGSCAYAVYQRLEGFDDACATSDNIDFSSDMSELTGMDQVSMSPEEIESRLLEEGEGSHAIIGIDRADGPGHWFNAACIDGKVVAIDGQTGEITDWPPDYGDVVNWDMSIRRDV